jgi:hypothetical protein
MGVAAAFMIAPKPTGVDRDHTVSVEPGQSALGGHLAFCLAVRRADRWRLTVNTGLGRAGISGALGFGGWGLAFGAATHRLFDAGPLAGVGLRLNLMAISASRDGSVRGEMGFVGPSLDRGGETTHTPRGQRIRQGVDSLKARCGPWQKEVVVVRDKDVDAARALLLRHLVSPSCARNGSSRIATILSGSPRFAGVQGPQAIPVLAPVRCQQAIEFVQAASR